MLIKDDIMDYKDKFIIIKVRKTADNSGGFVTEMVEIGNIRVKVAPYKVANGELVTIPNPIASVKFFTNSKLPVSEDEIFYIKYKDRLYKKVALTDYGKCALIIGERIGSKC